MELVLNQDPPTMRCSAPIIHQINLTDLSASLPETVSDSASLTDETELSPEASSQVDEVDCLAYSHIIH